MKLEVVTIGTELLLGQIIDTNAAELGRALAAAGAEVVRRSSVADRGSILDTAVSPFEAQRAPPPIASGTYRCAPRSVFSIS